MPQGVFLAQPGRLRDTGAVLRAGISFSKGCSDSFGRIFAELEGWGWLRRRSCPLPRPLCAPRGRRAVPIPMGLSCVYSSLSQDLLLRIHFCGEIYNLHSKLLKI